MADLSIIIPTHNRAGLLEECLRSGFAISRLSVEFVVVDDASTDETPARMEQLASEAGPHLVTYLRQEQNAGANVARNRGLSQAQSDHVQFVDSDDILRPEGIAEVYAALVGNATLDFAYGKVAYTDIDCKPIGPVPGTAYSDDAVEYAGYHWHTMGPIYRKSLIEKIGGWDLVLSGSQDLEIQARVKIASDARQFVDTIVGYRRFHEGERIGGSTFRPRYAFDVTRACKLIWDAAVAADKATPALARRLYKRLATHAATLGMKGHRKERDQALAWGREMLGGQPALNLATQVAFTLPGSDHLVHRLKQRGRQA